MISVIEHSCVEQKQWLTHEELMNMTVVAESTPGPIAINCATYVGYQRKGIPGALASTFGVVLPSFLVIFLISMVLENFLELTVVANALKGIQIAVGILILKAGLTMASRMKKKAFPVTVMVIAAVVMLLSNLLSVKISSVALMILAAVAGTVRFLVKRGGGAE